MNTSTNSVFLKEMGITEWTSREPIGGLLPDDASTGNQVIQKTQQNDLPDRVSHGIWWFFGSKPQGDTEVLFQNIIRILGLSQSEWEWRSPADNLSTLKAPLDGQPTIAFAFGEHAAQKISGERDSLAELRETVLALNSPLEYELPLIASFDLADMLSRPGEKALLWQDLLLARSVLQNI